jgi:hypothetical protein
MIHQDKDLSYIQGKNWEGFEAIIIYKLVSRREA